MGRTHFITRVLAAPVAALLISACTVHKQETPSLTGPSEFGTAIAVAISPDVLPQDGASQALVTVTARDSNGQPLRNLNLRAEIVVGGASADFGSLSARNLVTDQSGRATLTYTAPLSVLNQDTGTQVQIRVTPVGTDSGSTLPSFASLRLVPPGVVGAPPSALRPDFAAANATVGNPVSFQATVVDANNNDATSQVASYQWTFCDGSSASGRNVSRTFSQVRSSCNVSLTITDQLGRTQTTTHSITVGQGALPTASFVTSPSSPVVNQTVNFNASGSQAEPGHSISSYDWTFGDGSSGGGSIATHAYASAGTYTVTLQVTDDVGRKSTLVSQSITVGNGNPVAQITVSPPTGPATTTFSFIGSQSTAAPGRTIVRYDWNFGDNSTSSGATTSHRYGAAGTYTVTLIVTDDQGNQGIATATVTVSS
jgi:PKD repeat protein